MSTTEEIGSSKTLLPAKQPEFNPWLQRKLLKPTTSSTTTTPLPLKNSQWPVTTKEKSLENFKPLNKNKKNGDVLEETSDLPSDRATSTQRIKPTGKEKWVPYDATIIVDTKTPSGDKKKSNNKRKKSKRRNDNNNNKETKDSNEKNGKKKGEKKSRNNESKKDDIKDEKEIDEVTSKIEILELQESKTNVSEEKTIDEDEEEKENNSQLDKTSATISRSISPPILEERTGSTRRESKTFYNGGPSFRRSSSSQLNMPLKPIQSPIYSPLPPNYFYQPIYHPYFPQAPGYPMTNYNSGRYTRRNSSRNTSSSGSPDETTPSPSPPPNGYSKDSEPFFPQQYMGYYPVPPMTHQQPIYQMMPPPPLPPLPPSPHHQMPQQYFTEGYGSVYSNGKRSSKSRENFTRSNSSFNNSDRRIEIATQLDYYFSKENLLKDTYLRSNMQDGYVSLNIIANFLRFKTLTGGDLNLAIDSLSKCSNVEFKIVDDEYFLKSKFEYFFKK